MPRRQKAAVIPSKVIRLEVFDIQGHNGADPLDYISFFEFIREQGSLARREKVADRVVAVPSFTSMEGKYSFIAYAGSADTSFLVLDLETDAEEMRQIEDGKMIATRTVGLIDPVTRMIVVQYVHAGVRAGQIAALFEKLAHSRSTQFQGATLEFVPRARRAFEQEIAALERVQSASIALTRPNIDWDDFSTAATDFGAQSGAQKIEIAASAPRNGSLSKSDGIIQGIRSLVRGGTRSILKSAIVKGFRDEGSPLTTLNLNRYIESQSLRMPVSRTGLLDTGAVVSAANRLMNDHNEDR